MERITPLCYNFQNYYEWIEFNRHSFEEIKKLEYDIIPTIHDLVRVIYFTFFYELSTYVGVKVLHLIYYLFGGTEVYQVHRTIKDLLRGKFLYSGYDERFLNPDMFSYQIRKKRYKWFSKFLNDISKLYVHKSCLSAFYSWSNMTYLSDGAKKILTSHGFKKASLYEKLIVNYNNNKENKDAYWRLRSFEKANKISNGFLTDSRTEKYKQLKTEYTKAPTKDNKWRLQSFEKANKLYRKDTNPYKKKNHVSFKQNPYSRVPGTKRTAIIKQNPYKKEYNNKKGKQVYKHPLFWKSKPGSKFISKFLRKPNPRWKGKNKNTKEKEYWKTVKSHVNS